MQIGDDLVVQVGRPHATRSESAREHRPHKRIGMVVLNGRSLSRVELNGLLDRAAAIVARPHRSNMHTRSRS